MTLAAVMLAILIVAAPPLLFLGALRGYLLRDREAAQDLANLRDLRESLAESRATNAALIRTAATREAFIATLRVTA